jgi:hypothetical protein
MQRQIGYETQKERVKDRKGDRKEVMGRQIKIRTDKGKKREREKGNCVCMCA